MTYRVGIIGAGQMGFGIAVTTLLAGMHTTLIDQNDTLLHNIPEQLKKVLSHLVDKGKLAPERMGKIEQLLSLSLTLDEMAHQQLVIEAIPEDPSLKTLLFSSLDKIVSRDTILATNTSSISITFLASKVRSPENVIGLHFMNPAYKMELVEVIHGLKTSKQTLATALDFIKHIGKVAIVSKDTPGFVVNRILLPMINEAIFTVYENVSSIEEVDKAMILGTNQPMGPLLLADFIGLDTCLAILDVLYKEFRDTKYRPCPLLVSLVHAGWLGKKSGKGFYTYSGGTPVATKLVEYNGSNKN